MTPAQLVAVLAALSGKMPDANLEEWRLRLRPLGREWVAALDLIETEIAVRRAARGHPPLPVRDDDGPA